MRDSNSSLSAVSAKLFATNMNPTSFPPSEQDSTHLSSKSPMFGKGSTFGGLNTCSEKNKNLIKLEKKEGGGKGKGGGGLTGLATLQ